MWHPNGKDSSIFQSNDYKPLVYYFACCSTPANIHDSRSLKQEQCHINNIHQIRIIPPYLAPVGWDATTLYSPLLKCLFWNCLEKSLERYFTIPFFRIAYRLLSTKVRPEIFPIYNTAQRNTWKIMQDSTTKPSEQNLYLEKEYLNDP